MTLGEIATIKSGKNKSRNDDGKFNVYGSTGIVGKTDNSQYIGDNILIARVGANCGFIHLATGEYDVSDNTLILSPSEKYTCKFAYYQLTALKLNRYAKGGGQPLITAGQLSSLQIPLPTLSEQARIVNILDRFNALTTDITSGLSAEIAARQQQYEYYRDNLLTFKEKVA